MGLHRYGALWVDYGDPSVDNLALPAGLITFAGIAPTMVPSGTATLALPAGHITLAGVAPRLNPPSFPLARVQDEPASVENWTNASLTFAHADTDFKVTFLGPASGEVVVIVNPLWIGSASLSFGQCCMMDGATVIPHTRARIMSGNNRARWEYRTPVLTVTPGVEYTWHLGVAGDGTHAAGIQVGPENHALMYVLDTACDIQANRLGYFERPVQDGGTGGGGSIDEDFPSTTTWQKALLEGGATVDLPAGMVGPDSGLIMWGLWGTFVSASPATANALIGLWDNDTGALLPGSAMIEAGGFGSARHHPHLRKIVAVTPGAPLNLSVAHRCDDNGGLPSDNGQVFKFDQDAKEGPAVTPVYAVDA